MLFFYYDRNYRKFDHMCNYNKDKSLIKYPY